MCRGYERTRSHEFEHTRTLAYTIMQVNSTAKLPPMEKFWPLPTDDVPEPEDLNKYQKDLVAEYARLFPKKFGKWKA